MSGYNEIQCHGCGRGITVSASWIGGPHRLACTALDCEFVHQVTLTSQGVNVLKVEPVTRFKLPPLGAVSPRVGRDITEGIKAANAGCPRASVVMLRRALEQASLDAGASRNDTLFKKIEKLKADGVISPIIASTAHAIRAFGNEYGAHPDDDRLDDVSSEEVEAAIRLTTAVAEGLAKRSGW